MINKIRDEGKQIKIKLDIAVNIAKSIFEMNLTQEEVNMVRPSDHLSLMHLAICKGNPYLVSLYMLLGADTNYKPYEIGPSPIELYNKIGVFTEFMDDAFADSQKLLDTVGINLAKEDDLIMESEKFTINQSNNSQDVGNLSPISKVTRTDGFSQNVSNDDENYARDMQVYLQDISNIAPEKQDDDVDLLASIS